MKKILQFVFHRMVIGVLLMILQLALLILMMVEFQKYFVYFYAICTVISILVTLYLINNNRTNPAYKIAWMIPILLVPVFGGLFYIVGRNHISRHQREKMAGMAGNYFKTDPGSSKSLAKMDKENPTAANQSRYIERCGFCPPYENTTVEYLPLGEVKFERMLQELKAAKKFIFLEYFIIQEGKMWNPILEILEQKVQEGVEVRIIYDDFGCMLTLPSKYWETLEKKGIQCCVFNPFVPILSLRFNNRDHRKICVIDGWVGFTGGINLADEYINAYPKHGHWKDVSVMLKGEAVWGLTQMFLSMWDYLRHIQEDSNDFRPGVVPYILNGNASGYVQPYSDSPLDDEAVGETVYLNIISKAQRYVYICTPYLIISNEMITALCAAAKSGIDVRIITPHVADKWYVHSVTRAYYQVLVESGVKIYEYTPGFIHAKMFVADDIYGVVGTINLDFRSLYLHFECAVWMYQTPCLADMKADFLKTQSVSQEITLEQCRSVKLGTRLIRSILRVFAPLM